MLVFEEDVFDSAHDDVSGQGVSGEVATREMHLIRGERHSAAGGAPAVERQGCKVQLTGEAFREEHRECQI